MPEIFSELLNNQAVIGLLGVVVGSVITYVGQYFLFRFEYKKWRKEKKIEILKDKKKDLELKYKKYDKKLINAMVKPTFDAEMSADIIISFPENVRKAFYEAIESKKKETTENIKKNYHKILLEMKKSLLKIDGEINQEIN